MPKQINDQTVFKAVMALLAKNGYAGTTTKQIAEAADINEVTLFRKYGSKAELIIQAMAERAENEDIASLVQHTGDVEADLMRVVTQYLAFAEEHGEFFPIILSEMSRYPELQDALNTPMGMMQSVGKLIGMYQEAGILEREPPMHAVISLLGPLIVNTMVRKANHRALGTIPAPDLKAHVAHYLNGRKRATSNQ